MAESVRAVPTTLLTGFLGVGKTTTVRALLQGRPADERWAVVVNDFGEVGLDGAILSPDADGFAVAEIPGGCVCCTAGLGLQQGIVTLLRRQAPDRLLIEPSGLAHPGSIIDMLRRPGLREAVALRAVIGVVDVRHLRSPRHQAHPTWQAQWELADVLLGTHAEAQADVAGFFAAAETRWPAPTAVAVGAPDPRWLDLDPSPSAPARRFHVPGPEASVGWVFPRSAVFDLARLQEALQTLVRPGSVAPGGVDRLKGIFRTPGRVVLVQGTADSLEFSASAWRNDSRVNLIASGGGLEVERAQALIEAAMIVAPR